MTDFLILYEIKPRELENIILLGNELKKRGYSVEYLSFEHVNLKKYLQNKKYISRYYNKVKVVLTPSLYHDKELYSLVYYVCGKSAQVVNLRWEQSFSNEVERAYDSFQYPHGDARRAYHLCWGRASFDNMAAAGISADRLLVTGPLHMDLLRPEYRDYYFSKEKLFQKYSLPLNKKSVLFISSFAISSRTERQIVLEEKSAGQELYRDKISRTRVSYDKVLEWIEDLLRKEDCIFIYRPHPMENVLGELKSLEEKYGNFKVISQYSVKQWILICDIVTTWVSTSVAEAFFAGRPCKILQPVPIPEAESMSIYNGASPIGSEEEFLKNALEEGQTSVSEKVIRYYYDVQAIPSYIRLADKLEEIYHDDGNTFVWDDAKIKSFTSRKWLYIIQSLLVFAYIPTIDFLGKLRKRTGLSFGRRINGRLDSYQTAKLKNSVRLATDEEISQISERLKKLSE